MLTVPSTSALPATGVGPREDVLPPYLLAREFPGLNGLRGISILCVVVSHVFYRQEATFPLTFLGNWGVVLFFAISGFLITTLLTRERMETGTISLRKFYARRALRIFPLAYLHIGVMLILAWLQVVEIPVRSFVGAALYIRNLPQFEGSGWQLAHYWSLSVEEQYYLFVPLLLLLLRPAAFVAYSMVLTVVALLVSYLAYHVTSALPVRILSALLVYQVPLAVGSCAALLVCSRRVVAPRLSLGATAALLGLSALIYSDWVFFIPHLVKPLICSALFAVVMVSSIQQYQGPVFAALNNRPIVTVGLLSYSLYIWQQAFIGNPIFRHLTPWRLADTALNLVLLGMVAYVSYHWFEKPFLRLKDRLK